jgi:hypothetical protein
MYQISVSSIFQSIQQSETPYVFPHLTTTNADKQYLKVTNENTTVEEREKFGIFLKALGVPTESVTDYGVATYTDGVFSGFSPCFFGLREGKMGLLIGSLSRPSDKVESQELFIPCEVIEEERKEGKKSLLKWCYYLNEAEVHLSQRTDSEGKPSGKFVLKVQTQTDDYSEYDFSFPFLIDKSKEWAANEVIQLFKTGQFKSFCREFGTGSSRIWLSSNKAFTDLFRANIFPKEGVLILSKKGVTKVTPANPAKNITSDIYQSDWEILTTSHPHLPVRYEIKKEWKDCLLGEATNIQFTSATKNNEGYTKLNQLVGSEGTYSELALIHIVRRAETVTHTPVNTVSTIKSLMLMKAARYPELKEIINSHDVFDFAAINAAKTEDDLFPNYPTQPQIKPNEAELSKLKETLENNQNQTQEDSEVLSF